MAGGIHRGDVVRASTDISSGGGWFSMAPRYFVPAGTTGVVTDSPMFGDIEVRWDTGLIVSVATSKVDVVHRTGPRPLFW